MSLEKEIEQGWKLLEAEVPGLQGLGGVAPKFICESDHQFVVIIAPAPESIENPEDRDDLAEVVRDQVREMTANTVYNLADSWMGVVADAKQRPELVEFVQQVGLKRATEMGLITKRETLMCNITTRAGKRVLLCWYYDRDGDKITMTERRVINGIDEGRFANLFD